MKVFKCYDLTDLKGTRNSVNPTLEAINNYEYFILVHMTTSLFLDEILEKGLLPNKLSNNEIKDPGLENDPEVVYLSSWNDNFYMKRAVKNYGGEGIAVVVLVKKDYLEPDSNALPLAVKADNKTLNSLTSWGACKHRGVIPSEQIISIYSHKGEKLYANSKLENYM